MAYRIPNKSPVDQSARTAVGISVPFTKLFNSTYTTRDATRTNIINYLLTNKGERPLNPLFGSGLRGKVFEPITQETFSGLEVQIREEIERYFPSVEIKTLAITPEPDNYLINVTLTYSVLGNENDQVNITFNDIGTVSSPNPY